MTIVPLDQQLTSALAPPDLERVLEDVDDGLVADVLVDWEPHDLDSASWASRNLKHKQEAIANVKALCDEQRFRIDAFQAEQTAGLQADCTFFEQRLAAFHMRVIAIDKKALTVKLPDGTELRSQAGKLAVNVTDLAAFSMWAEQNGMAVDEYDEHDVVIRKGVLRMADPEPNKQVISERFSAKAAAEKEPGAYPAIVGETGETVPGVEIVRAPRSFTVSLG